MIKQYKITLALNSKNALSMDSLGYQFYGLLMEQIAHNYGAILHKNEISPINQYPIYHKEDNTIEWTINILGKEACHEISSALECKRDFYLRGSDTELSIKNMSMTIIPTDVEFYNQKIRTSADYLKYSMEFLTPTSFKEKGDYVIFPSMEFIVNNLIRRWNSYSDSFSIDDNDAVDMLINGVRIVGYNLHSCSYKMKGIRIPAFKGSITIHIKMAPPIAELFGVLLHFSKYSGIGIKTSLGMGATKIDTHYMK